MHALKGKAAFACAIAAMLVACKDDVDERKVRKRTECNALSLVLNDAARDLSKVTGKKSDDEIIEGQANEHVAEKRKKLAGTYDDIAKKIADVRIEDGPLAEHARLYGELCKELATKAGTIAEAIAKGEGTRAQAEQDAFNALVQRENTRLADINGYCARL